jgi:hypothetical protein
MLFGQRLVQAQIVTVEHVQQALQLQAVHGGRLGTNLLRKSFVDIDTLATILSKHVGAPAAKLKHFEQVDQETLGMVSAQIAVKHKAVPLAQVNRSGRELLVAFRDPHDVAAIDEIAFLSGARVRPFVAPELCILRYIERYYGVRLEGQKLAERKPSDRTRRIVEVQVPQAFVAPAIHHADAGATPLAAAIEFVSRTANLQPPWTPMVGDQGAFEIPRAPAPEDVAIEALALPSPIAVGPWEDQIAPSPEVAETIEDPTRNERPPPALTPRLNARPALALDAAIARLQDTPDRDDVGAIIIDYLRSSYGCGLVFIVKNDIALGWKGFAPGLEETALEMLSLPLSVPSVLNLAYSRAALFRGSPVESAGIVQSRLYKLLKHAPPSEVITAPIMVKKRVVNLIYAHAFDLKNLPDFAPAELRKLCEAASECFVRLIQAQKQGSPLQPQ